MSRVRVYPQNVYNSQTVLSTEDEPIAIDTYDNVLLIATNQNCIAIYSLKTHVLVAKFFTIQQAKKVTYCEFGNSVITAEDDNGISSTVFVRIYSGFPNLLTESCQEVNLSVSTKNRLIEIDAKTRNIGSPKFNKNTRTPKRSDGEKTKVEAETPDVIWNVEKVELPTQGAINCFGVCSHTGLLAVAWNTCITLYTLRQDEIVERHTMGLSDEIMPSSIRCGVTVLMTIEIAFIANKIVVDDQYIACISDFEAQILKLELLAKEFTRRPKQGLIQNSDHRKRAEESDCVVIEKSKDFYQINSFQHHPTINEDDNNEYKHDRMYSCYLESIMTKLDQPQEPSYINDNLLDSANYCVLFPAVINENLDQSIPGDKHKGMTEIWGPSRLIGHKYLRVQAPDGNTLANSGISTMLYLKLPTNLFVTSNIGYSMVHITENNKRIEMFHIIRLIPEYIFDDGKRMLVGMCCLVASQKEGHLYDIFNYCNKIATYPLRNDLIDILITPGLMHVIYTSTVEVYTNYTYSVASENARKLQVNNFEYKTTSYNTPNILESFDESNYIAESLAYETSTHNKNVLAPFYWLYQACPTAFSKDLTQISRISFMTLKAGSCTQSCVLLLSKSTSEEQTSGSLYAYTMKLIYSNVKQPESSWSIYILDIASLRSIARSLEERARRDLTENPPIYYQLLSDAHCLRKVELSCVIEKKKKEDNNNDDEELDVSTIDYDSAVLITMNPNTMIEEDIDNGDLRKNIQLVALQQSSLLIAEYLRKENEELALEYYKQGSVNLQQFLFNSLTPSRASIFLQSTQSDLQSIEGTNESPMSLQQMISNLKLNEAEANSLVRTHIQIESQYNKNEIDGLSLDSVKTYDNISLKNRKLDITYEVLSITVLLENNELMKAKHKINDLYMRGNEFLNWSQEHLNSFLIDNVSRNELSPFGLFALSEMPNLISPIIAQLCKQRILSLEYTLEAIKNAVEESEQNETLLYFCCNTITNSIENPSLYEPVAIYSTCKLLIELCLKLLENVEEINTRDIHGTCSQFRLDWLDLFPPFKQPDMLVSNSDEDMSINNIFIFIIQNFLCSPLGNLQLCEFTLSQTDWSDYFDGLKVLCYLKLTQYKELIMILLQKYPRNFYKVTDEGAKNTTIRHSMLDCLVCDFLVNVQANDVISNALRDKALDFAVSLTRYMKFEEIIKVLPPNSPSLLFKKCLNYNLQTKLGQKIVQDLVKTTIID